MWSFDFLICSCYKLHRNTKYTLSLPLSFSTAFLLCHYHNCHETFTHIRYRCHTILKRPKWKLLRSAQIVLRLTLSRLTRCILLSWSMVFISILSPCSIPSLSYYPSLPPHKPHSPVPSEPRLHFQPIRRHLCHRYPPHKGAQTGKCHRSSLSTASWQAQSSPQPKDPDPVHQGTGRAAPSAAHQVPAPPILPLALPFSARVTHPSFLLPLVLSPKVSD